MKHVGAHFLFCSVFIIFEYSIQTTSKKEKKSFSEPLVDLSGHNIDHPPNVILC